MKMKLLLLTIGSVFLTSAVVSSAFYQKKQFYPSVIYITKSSISMAALYLQALVFVILISKLLGKIFFGQLRPTEIEHLVERIWYAVTETCLAFTVFREDFSPKFVAMFTILLFFKAFHWLAEDRVDFMERSPVIPVKFHVRMIGLLSLLSTVDYLFILYAYRHTMEKGPNAQLVFGFEYTILKLSLIVIFCRYVLHTIDSRRETPWDQKATFMLYIDLISNFLKLVFYIMFLILMIKVHTLPLFIIRPVYLSMRTFKKTVQDLVLSRRAIHYMNTVFMTATQEELAAADNICIICREEMVAVTTQQQQQPGGSVGSTSVSTPKCLPCGHIFHCSCLKTWFQRQQTCPTCRMDILRNVAANRTGVAGQNRRQNPAGSAGANAVPPSTTPAAPSAPAGSEAVPGPVPPGLMMPPFPGAPFPWSMPPSPSAPGSSDQHNANFRNFMPAPMGSFMLPGMPLFSSPMPELTSADLARLSDEDLKRLERQGREGMEFRVQTLQQIHTLLDAAVLLMNAYMMSVRNIPVDPNIPVSPLDASPGAAAAPISQDEQDQAKGDKPTENTVQSDTNKLAPSTIDTKDDNVQVSPSNTIPQELAAPPSQDVVRDDEEISKIRDLRLRKFQSQSSEPDENKTENS